MSLLMDALKKAEEAKRQAANGQASSEASSAPLPPAAGETAGAAPTPRWDVESPAPVEPSIRETTERNAARNLFAVKQPPAPPPRSRLWLFLAAGVAIALGMGGYFWWQIQAIPARNLAASAPPPVPPAAPPPAAPAATAAPIAIAPPAAIIQPPAPASGDRAGVSGDTVTRIKPQPTSPARAVATPAPAAPEPAVRLTRTPPRTDRTIEKAYDSLQAGRYDEAQEGYERVLRADAHNTDALLGLATIAAQRGQAERAQALYQKALESDPGNAAAKAGVIATSGQAEGELAESRLKTALSREPDSPPLLFALANTYARQGRWSEAQQMYFRAYATDPENPDFLFNLAVSLDHLRQPKLAAQYYRMALDAADKRAAGFDRGQARNRLLELQP